MASEKATLQAQLDELGVEYKSKDTIADLKALLGEATAADAAEVSDVDIITVTCPTPGLTVGLPPYLVRIPADTEEDEETGRPKAQGVHQVVKEDRRHGRDVVVIERRVGADIDDEGYVTEPGKQKRLQFNDSGVAEVEKAAWQAFTRNGAHVSYGIRVAT